MTPILGIIIELSLLALKGSFVKMSERPDCQMAPEAQRLSDEVMNLENCFRVH